MHFSHLSDIARRWHGAGLCLAACLIGFPQAHAQSVRDTSLRVQEVASGLSGPTTIAFIGSTDMLVLQKGDGRVRRVINGVLQAGAVLDVAVDSASERGLLGITLHPSFPTTPYVYLFYTESGNGSDTQGTPTPLGNRVYRYTWNGSALISPTRIVDLPVTSGPNHDGGIIAFGPDRKLYVVIGDLNRNGQLQNNATGAAADDSGVILRLNEDGTTPNDNPFAAQGGNLAKYYAYGVRNSFGLAFDPVTGKLWDTENGPSSYDEINLVEPGFNSGWRQIMGPDARDPQGLSDLYQVPGSQYRDPAFSWLSPVGVTGIVFLNSTQLGAQYQNDVFVGDINNGNLYRFEPNGARNGLSFGAGGLADLVADDATERDTVVFGSGFGGITDLKVGPDGLLYVVSFSGKIYQISRNATVATTLGVNPTSVAAGGTVTATWNNIASPTGTNWIGLYTPGEPSQNHDGIWMYVNCTKTAGQAFPSGSCAFPIPANVPSGTYELRLHASASWSVIATSAPLTITGGTGGGATSVSVLPTSVAAGNSVNVSWSNIASATGTNWFGLYTPGAPSQNHNGNWMYVNCTKTAGQAFPSGSCTFPIPSGLANGNYEIRLHASASWNAIASTPLTITGGAGGTTIGVNPSATAAGGTVTVSWSGIASPTGTNWFGLYTPGAPSQNHNGNWMYVNCTKTPGQAFPSGSCSFLIPSGLASGNYEIRLHASASWNAIASTPLTIP